ncbi:MAG: tail fiber domain-containing protein [Patescibacteria group bacterium]|jgi:hypothetical protein
MFFFQKKSKPTNTKLWVMIAIIAVFAVFQTTFAATGLNKQINYQAKLTNNLGVSVPNGNYDIVFKIYDAASAGTTLWTGTYTAANGNPITVTNGVFNVLLGTGTGNTLNLDFSTDSYYLGVKVGADAEMTPRKRLGATPQAFNANNLIGDGFIKLTGTPTGNNVDQGTIYINPSSATAGYTLLGLAVNGAQKFKVDEAGNSTQAGSLTVGGDSVLGNASGDILTISGTNVAIPSNLNFDANTFFIDAINNRVGIGTAAPGARLDILGDTTTAVLGAELITGTDNSTFATTLGNWTGTGWSAGSGVATHTAGANNFSLATTYTSSHPTAGKTYQITFTINTTTTGTLTPQFGGVNAVAVGKQINSEAQTMVVVATGTGALTFVPDATWAGTLDDISVKEITPTTATQIVRNSDNSIGLEIRSGGATRYNNFIGVDAGRDNTTGVYNTANGYRSLYSNATGSYNTANGNRSLYSNTTGSDNTANGNQSLYFNTTGAYNTANGYGSLFSNTTGYYNTANGAFSLYSNITGYSNTALGINAGRYSNGGLMDNQKSGESLYLGSNTAALADGDINEVVIGYGATGVGSNSVVLGNDSIATTVLKGNIGIGDITPAALLTVGNGDLFQINSTGDVSLNGGGTLTLGSKATDPTGANGMSFYNSTTNKFRCYQNGAWTDCVGAGGSMAIGGTITSATAGSVLFAGTAGIMQQDNANFFWDDTNNRLGIGMAIPLHKLDVLGNQRIVGQSNYILPIESSYDLMLQTDTTNRKVYFAGNSSGYSIQATESSTGNAMSLSLSPSGGNVGIGDISPAALFTVGNGDLFQINSTGDASFNGGGTITLGSKTADPTGANGMSYYNSSTNKFRCYQNSAWTDCVGSGGTMAIGDSITSATAGSVLFAGTAGIMQQDNAKLFWDDTNNRLGIGTATPGTSLDVSGGSIRTTNQLVSTIATGTAPLVVSSTTGVTNLNADLWDGYQFASYLNQDVLTTSPVIFANIDTGFGANELYDMNQAVLTTSAVTFATLNTGLGAYELYAMNQNVTTTSAPTFLAVNLLGNSDFVLKSTSAATNDPGDIVFRNDAGTQLGRMWADSAGTVRVSAGSGVTVGAQLVSGNSSWTSFSDVRLKENIQTIDGALAKVLNMRGVYYNMTANPDDKREIGVIAQEVQPYFPDLVENLDGYLGVTYDRIAPVLIEAIKEQQVQITTSNSQIAGLVLKTDTDITNLQQLQSSIDTQLGVIQTSLTALATEDTQQLGRITALETMGEGYETRIATLETLTTTLQSQIAALQVDSAQNTLDISQAQLAMTNLEILLDINTDKTDFNFGHFTAENLETGLLTIKVVDSDAATIGTAVICPVGKKADASNQCVADATGDGKSVVVPTTAVSSGTKVFVTPKNVTDKVLAVTALIAGESFQVEIQQVTDSDLEFDWWIVEAK